MEQENKTKSSFKTQAVSGIYIVLGGVGFFLSLLGYYILAPFASIAGSNEGDDSRVRLISFVMFIISISFLIGVYKITRKNKD